MREDSNEQTQRSDGFQASTRQQIKNLPLKLVMATLLMFGFGFALVPLYDVFCDITGINGKGFERQTLLEAESLESEATKVSATDAMNRKVKVQFIAQPQTGFSGDFYPQSSQLSAPVDTSVTTAYVARNATKGSIKLQAIPSISPAEASSYVTKMECFCFQQQALEAGQEREMGLTFSISSDLPEHIKKVTFSYSLYPLEDQEVKQQATIDQRPNPQSSHNPSSGTQLPSNATTIEKITGGKHHEPNT